MRTTRRPRWPLGPQLAAYVAIGVRALDQLFSLPTFGVRAQAIHRARANWLHEEFIETASDEELVRRATEFYEQVVPVPLFRGSLQRRPLRLRQAASQLLRSPDHWAVRIQRCLNGDGAFCISGLGAAFWSAAAQGCDPLRLPSWTRDTVTGARRLGLIRRKTIWYGDLIGACDAMRKRDPRLTASHVDHFLTIVARQRPHATDAFAQFDDPIPKLLEAERQQSTLSQRINSRRNQLASARTAMLLALRSDDVNLAIAALESIDGRLGPRAREWDRGTLMQWIAWIWHDDDPIQEVSVSQCRATSSDLALTSAVLHLRSAERFPLWDSVSARCLARLAEGNCDSYPLFAEGFAVLCQRYDMHVFEAPSVLAKLASHLGVTS